MKHILIMRHAKSRWSENDVSDHQRPLNPRGKRDAPVMAQRLLNHGVLPDIILSSDANRTRQTSALILEVLGKVNISFEEELYLSSPSTMISLLSALENDVEVAMLIAHNPGITEVFESLADVKIDNVPTSGLGCIRFDIENWKDLADTKGELVYFDYPKL